MASGVRTARPESQAGWYTLLEFHDNVVLRVHSYGAVSRVFHAKTIVGLCWTKKRSC